jgi:hypothetical protein
MMKFLILCLTPIVGLSQGSIILDNNLTGIYSTSNVSKLNLNFVGNNSFEYKKYEVGLSTNYSLTFTPKVSQNEFAQKINLSISDSTGWYGFVSYQYNYSLIRALKSDNWIGIGGGYKRFVGKVKLSASYAVLYQNQCTFDNSTKEIFRHSFRVKVKYNANKISFFTEYYFQPSFIFDGDDIIYGTTKVTILAKKHVNLILQDVFNYSSRSNVKIIHNVTMGVGYNLHYNFKKKVDGEKL